MATDPQAPRKGSPVLRAIWRIVRTAGIAYCAVLVLAWIFQRRLLYFPSPGPVVAPSGPGYEGLEEFTVAAADGVRLLGWYWPAGGTVDLLVFHGNGGHRGHRTEWLEDLRSIGVGVCIIDYRGYGGSEGRPTENGLYLDADAALAWLRQRGAKRIVYLGESLGTAVAVDLASRSPPDALILQSGFSSAVDVGQAAYPFLPVRLLMRDRFDSAAKIGRVTCPILVIHGARDSIVPVRFGRALHDAAGPSREWYEIPDADHNDLPWVGGKEYLRRIGDFIRERAPR